MPPKDAEKVVRAATKAMVWSDGGPATVRVMREYEVDARAIFIAGLKEALRQGWEINELVGTLSPAKPKKKRGEAVAPPRSVP